MEKIAIFDTAGGNPAPTPPITTSAISMIYGTYGVNDSTLYSTDEGRCNLMGGGNEALVIAGGSVAGNVFLATYDIVSDFYISFGAIAGGGGVAEIRITLYQNGSDIVDFTTISVSAYNVIQRQFSGFNQFIAGNSYHLRFSILNAATSVQILGWSIGVKFNSLP